MKPFLRGTALSNRQNSRLVGDGAGSTKTGEDDLTDRRMSPEPFRYGRDGNFNGAPGGKPVNTGADDQKSDCRQRVIRRDFQTAPVTGGQQRFFIGPAAKQRGVRGIDNCIDVKLGDIGFNYAHPVFRVDTLIP